MWSFNAGGVTFSIDELGNPFFKGTIAASGFTNDELTIDSAGNVDSTGTFRFGGAADNFVDFNGTQLVIDTPELSVDGSGNATFGGELSAATGVLGNPAGNRVEYDGVNLIVETPDFSVDASGNASFSGSIDINSNFVVDSSGNLISEGTFLFGDTATDKTVEFDGTELIIGDAVKLKGADAYNNDSIYIRDVQVNPPNTLTTQTTGSGVLSSSDNTEGSWFVDADGGGQVISRYTLSDQSGIRLFDGNKTIKFKARYNPGTFATATVDVDFARIGWGQGPNGFDWDYIAVFLETKRHDLGGFSDTRQRGVVIINNTTTYTTAWFNSTGVLEIIWVPIGGGDAEVTFLTNGSIRGTLTVASSLPTGVTFAPFFAESYAQGSSAGAQIRVGEFVFLQE